MSFQSFASDTDERNNFRQIALFWLDLKMVFYPEMIFFSKQTPVSEKNDHLIISKTYFETILL